MALSPFPFIRLLGILIYVFLLACSLFSHTKRIPSCIRVSNHPRSLGQSNLLLRLLQQQPILMYRPLSDPIYYPSSSERRQPPSFYVNEQITSHYPTWISDWLKVLENIDSDEKVIQLSNDEIFVSAPLGRLLWDCWVLFELSWDITSFYVGFE
jgi:hypothetical protein